MDVLIRFIVRFFLLAVEVVYDYRSYAQFYAQFYAQILAQNKADRN